MEELGNLNTLDYAILVVYFIALISMSYWLGRSQEDKDDYFVGGRNLPWWAIGLSTAATQSSAIGFMSIPAFIAMKEGGGLLILQGEFILPISMIFIMILFIPFFRNLNLVSVYEYLERRFGADVKFLISSIFLLSRGLGTAIGLYMTAIVFSTVFKIELIWTIIIIGVITLIYDTLGGIKAVVYSDVVQMLVLIVGVVFIVGYAVSEVGGFAGFKSIIASDMAHRVQVLDFGRFGIHKGEDYAFWPQFIGGFFLLASYYGCDQTQTQRELSASSLEETRNSLIFNGFFRFPLTLMYGLIGLSVGAYVIQNTEFAALVNAQDSVDYMLPIFIMNHVPHGIKALIFVAVLAAAMSSLDSSINSLSAATLVDFINPLLLKGRPTPKQFLIFSKGTTVLWGAIVTVLALFVGDISDTVIESINKVGSTFYGPILAAFLCGVALPKVGLQGVIKGIIAGVAFNCYLWVYQPQISWWWWNAIGCLITIGVAVLVSLDDEIEWVELDDYSMDRLKKISEKEKFPHEHLDKIEELANKPLPKSELAAKLQDLQLDIYEIRLVLKLSLPAKPAKSELIIWNTHLLDGEKKWIPRYLMLVGYSVFMFIVCWLIPKFFGV